MTEKIDPTDQMLDDWFMSQPEEYREHINSIVERAADRNRYMLLTVIRRQICCDVMCNGESDLQDLSYATLALRVPTYNYTYRGEDAPEFGEPTVPVLIREADGVRVVLGTHDFNDYGFPDIQIERQPKAWVIFVHPMGGSDPCGYLYILDDGRSFFHKEHPDPTPEIGIIEAGDPAPPEVEPLNDEPA